MTNQFCWMHLDLQFPHGGLSEILEARGKPPWLLSRGSPRIYLAQFACLGKYTNKTARRYVFSLHVTTHGGYLRIKPVSPARNNVVSNHPANV